MGKKNTSSTGTARRRGKSGGRGHGSSRGSSAGPRGRGKFASITDDRRPDSSLDQDKSYEEHEEDSDGNNSIIYLIAEVLNIGKKPLRLRSQ